MVEALLKGTTKGTEVLTALEALDDKAEVPANLIDMASDTQSEYHFSNDKERLKSIRSENKGRVYDEAISAFKKASGVSGEDLKDLKTYEEIIGKGIELIKKKSGLSDNERVKEIERLQGVLVDKDTEIKNLREVELPKITADANEKLLTKERRSLFTSEMSSKKVAGSEFQVKSTNESMWNELNAEATIDIDEATGKHTLKDKNGAVINKPGTKEPMTVADWITAKGTANGIFTQSNEPPANSIKFPLQGGQNAGDGKDIRTERQKAIDADEAHKASYANIS